jgi:hypothetical protein
VKKSSILSQIFRVFINIRKIIKTKQRLQQIKMEKERLQQYCRTCNQNNTHEVQQYVERSGAYDEEIRWNDSYKIVECMGCHTLAFRHQYGNEEMFNLAKDGNAEYYEDIETYPVVLEGHSELINKELIFAPSVKQAYNEAVTAYKNKCLLLTSAGFRLILEAVCLDKKVSGNDLHQSLANLHSNGFITKSELANLMGVKILGNDSVHRLKIPNPKQLSVALTIIQNLLRKVYNLDDSISHILDTAFTNYDDFEEKLDSQLKKFRKGDQRNLQDFLGDYHKRFLEDDLKEFESQLKEKISKKEYTNLKLGKIKNYPEEKKIPSLQFYVLAVEPDTIDNNFWW